MATQTVTITGIFTTQAILKGVGVGSAEASALSATITWIMKDGTGMIGRIVFAWWKGKSLDSNCKKWRLFADLLNDGAMILELSIPHLTHLSTEILCLSTLMKSMVGVAGGATRASITNHQAIKGNMAEIAAKDGSQETLVNLIASFTGIFLINYFTDATTQWIVTFLLIFLHLYSNYQAVTALIFKNLNNLRMTLVLKSYLAVNAVLGPERINKMESVCLGFGTSVEKFCGFKIILGQPLGKTLRRYNSDELKCLTEIYKDKKYLIVPDLKTRIIYVTFEKGETPQEVIAGFYHAVLLGLATCIYNRVTLEIYSKRQLHHSTPITRLSTFMKNYQNNGNVGNNLPAPLLQAFTEFVGQEIEMFFTALQVNGWKTDSHCLYVDEWRAQWKDFDKKSL
ncbi:RUS family member 1 isoform X2 [Tribolium madens]|uniref:RUS family member 1 isoform X2 n=1 Tax=Tribolium madens TaxID=41895 RepID=UPI001CF72C3A|nr:RUS family member 1 isoform X2 [Tribolium madens]